MPVPTPARRTPGPPPDTSPRNVVLILTDDQRFDGFSFMAHPFLRTPALDQLAASGAWCAESFVTTSLCCPSRASMLTGLYAHQHGVLDNQSELPPSIPSYAQRMQRAGVQTAYIGKWHMGAKNPHPRPGWDHWVGFRGQGRYTYPGPDTLTPADRGFSHGGELRQASGYVTDLLTDEAIAYLEAHKGDDVPFCLVVAHKACHAPFVPAPRHADAFTGAPAPAILPDTDEAYAGLPDWLRRMRRDTIFGIEAPYGKWPDFASWYRDYHRTLLAVDEGVARIRATLEQTGLADRTAVLYTSDNGFMHGEKGVLDKRNAFEPSIRIPLLISAPGLVPPGSRIDELILNVDLAPTLLELVGLSPPDDLHGRSLVPLLAAPPDARPRWRSAFLYEYFFERRFPTTPTVFAVRTRAHKYITYHGVDTPPALYDLRSDPTEQHDLANDPAQRELKGELEARLRRSMARVGLMPDPVWGRSWLDPGKLPRSKTGG
ncbi:MAG TPA: DUF4976 domain-containing protein [Deltaproteobacteria bacterium]|nr:DUF4976 domain-containing protein [Deltaproteobacteria bacterium]